MKEKYIQKLINRAVVARDKTYSPYSHFGVRLRSDGAG